VSVCNQAVAEIGTHKTGAAGNENVQHIRGYFTGENSS
jgi:hypothetical protein